MNKWILAIMILVVSVSCSHHEAETEPSRRTVLVYMEAKNNLTANAIDDLDEMLRATVPGDCRLLVYRSTYADDPELLEIRNGEAVSLKKYPASISSVDPAQLSEVMKDAARFAPAEERGLVLWSHGAGWTAEFPRRKQARSFGMENMTHVMSIPDLAEALKDADLDYIYFDACFMASVEVAYELRHCADWMVASSAETPAPGMPYDLTVPALFANDIPGAMREIIDIVADYYDANPSQHGGCPRTLSLVDLSKMDNLAQETRRIVAKGEELPAGLELQRFAVASIYRNLYFDLKQWVDNIGGDDQWRDALNRAVVFERHSPVIWTNALPLVDCCGLTVFVPNSGMDYTTYGYNELSWYKTLFN